MSLPSSVQQAYAHPCRRLTAHTNKQGASKCRLPRDQCKPKACRHNGAFGTLENLCRLSSRACVLGPGNNRGHLQMPSARKQGDHCLSACAMPVCLHTHVAYTIASLIVRACVHVCVCVCVCVCLCLRARVVYAQVLSEGQAFGAVNSLALGPHSAGGQDRGHERDKVEMVMEGRITRRRWV